MDEQKILARIRAQRARIRMTRNEFSALLGMTRRQSWRMETGAIRLLAADVPRIARVLKTTPGALYGERRAVRGHGVRGGARRAARR